MSATSVPALDARLKRRFHRTDIAGMSKRAMLWMVGLVAVAFTVFGGANIGYQITSGGIVYCRGIDRITDWFSNSAGCEELLPGRLSALALGVVVLLICGYFAEKDQPRGAPPRGAASPPSGHVVCRDPRDSLYWCRSCGFWNRSEAIARKHVPLYEAIKVAERPTPGKSSDDVALGFTKPRKAPSSATLRPVTAPVSAPVQREFKTCPDCAEDVRFAARKCRFCGYMFELESAPSSSS